MLRPVLAGITATFGRNCEVVLHDYRDPEHSVIAVEGDVTHRHVGGAMSQIGLSLFAQGDDATDPINYITRTPDGRSLRSSTMLLRDGEQHVFGALCINFDVTDLRMLTSALVDLAGGPAPNGSAQSMTATFADDIGQVIRAAIEEEEASRGCPVTRMSRADRIAVVRALDERGIFALQRSVPEVAALLGVSRATAYAYLYASRASKPETGSDGDTS